MDPSATCDLRSVVSLRSHDGTSGAGLMRCKLRIKAVEQTDRTLRHIRIKINTTEIEMFIQCYSSKQQYLDK